MATNGLLPRPAWAMNSDADSSDASNSSPPIMRSKICRPDGNTIMLRSMPSTCTSPERNASMRSYLQLAMGNFKGGLFRQSGAAEGGEPGIHNHDFAVECFGA